jgi:hypothetical protein
MAAVSQARAVPMVATVEASHPRATMVSMVSQERVTAASQARTARTALPPRQSRSHTPASQLLLQHTLHQPFPRQRSQRSHTQHRPSQPQRHLRFLLQPTLHLPSQHLRHPRSHHQHTQHHQSPHPRLQRSQQCHNSQRLHHAPLQQSSQWSRFQRDQSQPQLCQSLLRHPSATAPLCRRSHRQCHRPHHRHHQHTLLLHQPIHQSRSRPTHHHPPSRPHVHHFRSRPMQLRMSDGPLLRV